MRKSSLIHDHIFQSEKSSSEKRTLFVFILTLLMMVVEIAIGLIAQSMALYADGWHMGTHAAALGIAALAYIMARRHARDPRYAFGTWKIEILGAYTSAIVLGIVAISMIFFSIERLFNPADIRYADAIVVAVIGLAVNIVSALILMDHHHHEADHHSHGGDADTHHHHDLNLQAALIHVIADAVTSLLAIVALIGAWLFSLNFLDPLMGLVGAGLILRWTYSLLRQTGPILLDREMDAPIVERIKTSILSDGQTQISDIHVWRVSQNSYAALLVLIGIGTIEDYKERLANLDGLRHITIELYREKDFSSAVEENTLLIH